MTMSNNFNRTEMTMSNRFNKHVQGIRSPPICHPPPPPPPTQPPGLRTAQLAMNTIAETDTDNPCNTSAWNHLNPGTATVTVTHTGAGIWTIDGSILDNNIPHFGNWHSPGAPGEYHLTVKFKWPDGFEIVIPQVCTVFPA